MKNHNGMGHITLIICIIAIILAIVVTVNLLKVQINEGKEKDIETDMLLLQGKVKVMSQEATIQKNEEILKGKKVSENLENEYVKELIEKNIILTEDENIEKCYIIDKSDLEEIGLGNIELIEGIYVVNYNNYDIIYSKGIQVGENIYYKLSDLQNIIQKNEKNENITDGIEEENNLEDNKEETEISNEKIEEQIDDN